MNTGNGVLLGYPISEGPSLDQDACRAKEPINVEARKEVPSKSQEFYCSTSSPIIAPSIDQLRSRHAVLPGSKDTPAGVATGARKRAPPDKDKCLPFRPFSPREDECVVP